MWEVAITSSVARGGRGGSSPTIGLKGMQNRTFVELLKPIFAQKMKTAPPPRRDLVTKV